MTRPKPPTYPPGLYDLPISRALDATLSALPASLRAELEDLDPHEAPEALARVLHARIVNALAALPGAGKPDEKLAHQLAVTNNVLALLRDVVPKTVLADDDLAPPARRLLALSPTPANNLAAPSTTSPASTTSPPRPSIPLATSDLLVNGRHDLSLGPEVIKEIASADRVDLLCSFLKFSGLRIVRAAIDALLAAAERAPAHPHHRLHGRDRPPRARRAREHEERRGPRLLRHARTRLHAKAWLFHRDSGFSTGFVGSSNLSAPAMLDGLEWNVRLSSVDNGAILDKFQATFEQYWEDPEFRPYEATKEHQDAFDQAVKGERTEATDLTLRLDVLPRPHQQEILDDLEAERAAGHHRNLVVAATGTGKTVVAALDYKRLPKKDGARPTLLFVAHRKEILEQSLDDVPRRPPRRRVRRAPGRRQRAAHRDPRLRQHPVASRGAPREPRAPTPTTS